MKNFLIITLVVTTLMNWGCSSGNAQKLNAKEFAAKSKSLPSAPIVDVRTPEEFSKGHLINALNYDWNGNDFDTQISTLDKSKPVFVYCLSGGRSSSVANKMRADGFKEVYELAGGIMDWRGENLPEITDNKVNSAGMNLQQFGVLLKTDKIVLVDFYADWCAPCKKMKPYLEEISKEMSEKVTVIRINADDNQQLCKDLKVNALPVLQIYKTNEIKWNFEGFIGKEEVVKQLNSNL